MGAHEHVVVAVGEVAVVADVAEQEHVAERRGAVGLGHARRHRHRLAAAAAVVADGGEGQAVGAGRPGPGLERDLGRAARDEVLAGQQRQDVPAEPGGRRGRADGAQPGGEELPPAQAARAHAGILVHRSGPNTASHGSDAASGHLTSGR